MGEVLQEFERQSGIRLTYVNSLVDSFQILTKIDDPPHAAMRKILLGTPFDFIRESSGLWIIVPRDQTKNLPATLTGHVLDAGSQQSIAEVNVYLQATNFSSTTNASGFFELKGIPPGRHQVVVNRIGYQNSQLNLRIIGNSHREVNITLEPQPLVTPEITVESKFISEQQEIVLTKQLLTKEQIAIAPIGNDGDIFETLHQQPGVSRRDLDDVFPHIEGGSATEVLIELDEMPIYVPTYGANRRSVFATPLIESVELHRSGYGARYGGAMSGVIAIKTSDVDENSPLGYSSASLTGLTLNFNKKFSKLGWSSIWRSGKSGSNLDFVSFQGHDFFNKFQYGFSQKAQLTLLAMLSYGAFEESNSEKRTRRLSQGFGIRYDYRSNNKISHSLLLYRTSLTERLYEYGMKWKGEYRLSEQIGTFFGINLFDLKSEGNASLDTLERFKIIRENFAVSEQSPAEIFNQRATILSPYFGINLKKRIWSADVGLRMPGNLRSETINIEPRIQVTFKPSSFANFTLSAGQYHQYTDRSYATEAKSGDGFGTGEFDVNTSSASASMAEHLRGEVVLRPQPFVLSFSLFNKTYDFSNRAYLCRINNWIWLIPLKSGKSSGAEFWVGKMVGRMQGWLSYTLSNDTYLNSEGTEFTPYFSRERILNLSLINHLSKNWSVKGQFLKASGYPMRNWDPETTKIDPNFSTSEFAEKFLTSSENQGSFNQLSFGLNWYFNSFAQKSSLSFVAVHAFGKEISNFTDPFRVWLALSFTY